MLMHKSARLCGVVAVVLLLWRCGGFVVSVCVVLLLVFVVVVLVLVLVVW